MPRTVTKCKLQEMFTGLKNKVRKKIRRKKIGGPGRNVEMKGKRNK